MPDSHQSPVGGPVDARSTRGSHNAPQAATGPTGAHGGASAAHNVGPLSNERLADIDTRTFAATPGPWCTDSAEIYQGTEYEPGLSMWIGETCRANLEDDGKADATFIAHARTDIPALAAEVRRLTTELATARGDGAEAQRQIGALKAQLAVEKERYRDGLRRADEHVNAMNEEVKRYADGTEAPVLWSVYNAMHSRAATAEARVAELETYAHGCDGEGCVLPHSAWCERAKKTAAENHGCTCPQPWTGHPQTHAGYCWLVSPPRDEVEQLRRALAASGERDTAPAAPPRTLTPAEHNAAWHAIEGAAGEDGADPGTILRAVLDRLDIATPTAVDEMAASLTRDGFGPDEIADMLGRPAAGTDLLPAWLYQRFMSHGVGWENLDAGERSYWEHQAGAVRRAVARDGFKTDRQTEPPVASGESVR